MLSKKPLILILPIAFFAHCSKGQTQENSMPLLFALAVGKAQRNNQQSELIATAKQRGSLMLSCFRGWL
ncbi:hypothetical protein [Endozoicomonas sp. 4G]|uniref:hypothetical protein n=1 Tax=Endozoicomonas sp. 4G TaxID=2872754 RepID=UPI0020787FEE|nr:hypothetical protein [Endozoicomonas sp. 4G]